ncbi:hypothetical protein LZG74_24975 [Dyadobacter sp. CY327]|uniref:hypothetical protein n=1 Tax=Dyadobacter sp. CY327 TaxID=2907301 RepID=UPI001F31486A|nr:hypothetical protein [Dyadobacter sp. CY327]MCE7073590.1 hypothetical protein [Dyadobacter sp. CY327]
MSPFEKKNLEQEIIDLKKLLDFYVGLGSELSSLKGAELEAHIDSILDRLQELKSLLDI